MSDQAPAPTENTPPDPRWRLTPVKIAVTVILLVTTVVPLIVPSYSRIEPRLLGFPFFYWYQLLWVFLCAAACGVCFWLIRDRHRTDAPKRAASPGEGDA
jgi:asparagine N-glycosylation enzyme membrane subunit Stt3